MPTCRDGHCPLGALPKEGIGMGLPIYPEALLVLGLAAVAAALLALAIHCNHVTRERKDERD